VEPHRRITLGVGLAMFVDAALYLAVLPLQPHYAERFHLSTFGVAIVLAAYPAASPLIALACIPLAPRLGGRRIAIASGIVMTISTIVFAFAPNAPTLVVARFLQGVASGTVWTSSMAWVTHNAPPDRRGRESGIVMGLLSAGSIAGPLVGAFAAWAGTRPAFLSVAAISALSLVVTALAPAGTTMLAGPRLRASLRAAIRQPFVRAAVAMSLVDTMAFATIDLLVPLNLGKLGASTLAIALAITSGAVLGAVIGPPGGRLVDRLGPGVVGLATGTAIASFPLVLSFGLPRVGLLAVLVIAGPVFTVLASAMYPLASAGADEARVSHVAVNGLLGACWAIGFTTAPLIASVVAAESSQAVAFVASMILCIPLLVVIARNGRGTLTTIRG
jgi:MFS transporter, DHA1 family, solute carrier family 18 (vesicular amine transporter), member 1/2